MTTTKFPLTVDIDESEPSVLDRVHEWIVTVDHKRLGIMYISLALVFLVVGGIEATLIRVQLAVPDAHFISPEVFNTLFTMHGTTMVFLMGMPILAGFANYLVPLQIGARDLAFPRLNSFAFWITCFGGLLLYSSYITAQALYGGAPAPDFGWFGYAPLTEPTYSRGNAADYWIIGLIIVGFGSIAGAVNVGTTILTMRTKGMTLGRMPLFTWITLVTQGMILIVVSPLTAVLILLFLDRALGAHIFDTQAGGSAVLWRHFFWWFGHPEVYVLMLPGFGFVSEIIPVFSRKVIFGYPVMVAATVAIGFISMSVWAHHMFAVGMSPAANTFFAVSTGLVGIPTGIKLFNWIGTMWGGRIRMTTAMLFCIAFLLQFLCAGITGVMLAIVPFDWQLTETYFVVAHFHFVLIGGLIFTVFAAFYYWFPKATGRMLDERLGKWHFWLFLIGFNLTFISQHFAGMLGMPRRIYTFLPERGLELWNLISSVGVPFQLAGVACLVWNMIRSFRRGAIAGGDPWDAWTLEWATSSPPAEYNFAELPVVHSRRPLWDLKHPEDPDWQYE
ncbi:MAG TPA: cytochrome c oxidase subunit I [Gemmatimonadales bacterium]|nr:cytochrome c oxidase subunit I [Gemmatimonadales bacterium]